MAMKLEHAAYKAIVLETIQAVQVPVFDMLPSAGAPYPFVHIENLGIYPDASTKSDLCGSLSAVISVWGLRSQRGTVASIAGDIYDRLARINLIDSQYRLTLMASRTSIEVMPDNSTNEPLWRARLRLEWQFY